MAFDKDNGGDDVEVQGKGWSGKVSIRVGDFSFVESLSWSVLLNSFGLIHKAIL